MIIVTANGAYLLKPDRQNTCRVLARSMSQMIAFRRLLPGSTSPSITQDDGDKFAFTMTVQMHEAWRAIEASVSRLPEDIVGQAIEVCKDPEHLARLEKILDLVENT